MKTAPITTADIDQRMQALDAERAALQILRRFIQPGRAAEVFEVPIGVPMAEIERVSILAMLERCGGNKTEAADRLGISRRTVATKLEYYTAGRCLGPGCGVLRQDGDSWPYPSLCPTCAPPPRRRAPALTQAPADGAER